MSLTASLNTARSALAVSGGLSALVSRNIAGVNDPNYARRSANVISLAGGGVAISSIARATNKALFDVRHEAASQAGMHQAVVASLDRLEITANDPALDSSPAALIGKFSNALQVYASSPQDPTAAAAAVSGAKALAQGLNNASATVQGTRALADADIASSVDRINTLLAQLETVNGAIVGRGGDISDQLDERDAILSQLSQEIGIKTISRGENDIVVYTDSGVTLFETTARAVSFQTTGTFSAGVTGHAVYVDGVPVTGDAAAMGIHSGRIAGLVEVRDEVAPAYQSQLDEIARGLIAAFAETDQGAVPSLPEIPGLFTWAGAPAMPGGSLVPGLAASISIAASVDPDADGDASLLRDGAISDPGNAAYIYNQTGAAGFSDRLRQLNAAVSEQRSFDPSVGIGATATLTGYAASSVGWLESTRQAASGDADFSATLLSRAEDALSNATGVNLDEEMTLMLEIERSYQASAKLIQAIDKLFEALMAAV